MTSPQAGPTQQAIAKLPAHLRRYVVDQDYAAYTPRDQAVWRHILRRLTGHLKDKAHGSYLQGLEATGIGLERIPSLDEMNLRLAKLGWSAVAVRGFIPPAVFTELQALRVLAIAADIRTHEHVDYTPAPDIVHESAGHAPILADARYAEYLRRCGVAAGCDRAVDCVWRCGSGLHRLWGRSRPPSGNRTPWATHPAVSTSSPPMVVSTAGTPYRRHGDCGPPPPTRGAAVCRGRAVRDGTVPLVSTTRRRPTASSASAVWVTSGGLMP